MHIELRAGQVTGRDHMLRGANCQDSYAVQAGDSWAVGVVCDGCGSGKRSEVGATLAADFIATQAANLLDDGVALAALPELLYPRLLDFLGSLLHACQPSQPVQFIHDHLLFTVLVVIVRGDAGLVLAAGDGIVVVDDRIDIRDEDNQPRYAAYELFDEAARKPGMFAIDDLGTDWQRIMIASDGFEIDLLPDVWALTHPRALQRRLNVWSSREHRFRDDATVLTMEKVTTDAGQN